MLSKVLIMRLRTSRHAAVLLAPLVVMLLVSCGGGSGGSAPPVVLPGPTPTPAPTPAPAPTPTIVAMPAVAVAANASPVANLYIIVGDARGVVYRFQKGSFSSTVPVPVASASKLLTSLVVMRLVDRGVLRLDDNPQRVLSNWTSAAADPRSGVTLQQLLSFTSGFNTEGANGNCMADPATTLSACVQGIYAAGLTTAPGTAYAYASPHLQIAGAMAEAATGKPMAQIIREELTTPFGLTATSFPTPSATNPRMAGGAFSTVEDYAIVMAALLDGRMVRDLGGFVQDRTAGLTVLFEPEAAIENGDWHYALGAWRECDDTPFSVRCASQRTISSPGAFGWTPWIDVDRGYWAIIGMQQGLGSIPSVRLEQQIQPLIATALGVP